jgi:type IV pilus assembly protein PilA
MHRMKNPCHGFTLIEIIVVLAVVAILATIAVPSIQGKLVRDQIVEAMKITEVAKPPIAAMWALTHTLPADNAGAALPAAEKIVGNLVSSVTVDAGAIHVTFGNRANTAIKDKVLTLRPSVVEDAPIVPLAWVCGHAEAVEKMTAKGTDRTSVPDKFLPLNCLAKKK